MTLSPLYRSEVLVAKPNRWLGALILRQPVSHWVFTFAAIAFTLAVAAVVVFASYARKTRLAGRTVSSVPMLHVAAPMRGHLTALNAELGTAIDSGAVIGEFCATPADTNAAADCQPLRAAQSGRVAVQLVQTGQVVAAGDDLLLLRPADARVEAELDLPARSIAGIEPGQEVRLRYASFPYQEYGQYGGRVAHISESPQSAPAAEGRTTATPSEGRAPATPSEPMYRVRVSLDRQSVRDARGVEHALYPGLPLESDVVLERRTLYRWLLRPLLRD